MCVRYNGVIPFIPPLSSSFSLSLPFPGNSLSFFLPFSILSPSFLFLFSLSFPPFFPFRFFFSPSWFLVSGEHFTPLTPHWLCPFPRALTGTNTVQIFVFIWRLIGWHTKRAIWIGYLNDNNMQLANEKCCFFCYHFTIWWKMKCMIQPCWMEHFIFHLMKIFVPFHHWVKDGMYDSTRLRLVEWNISSFTSWKYLYHCTHRALINIHYLYTNRNISPFLFFFHVPLWSHLWLKPSCR